METPSTGQDLAAGAAAAAADGASGSGPAGGEAIDLSLDDIIRNNKKGQTNPKARRWRQPFQNRIPAFGNGRPGFRSWGPRNLSGPNRFRGGFGKQPFYKKRFWNGGTRPGQSAPLGPSGRSPLNRPASAQQGTQQDATKVSSGGEDGAAAKTPQGPSPRFKQFRNLGGPPPAQSNRPFRNNQRQSRFNFSRRQQAMFRIERRPSGRQRWQPQPNLGAVLTVSVSNLQAGQANIPRGAQRPFLRGRGTPTKTAGRQPKGVPLRFNFRAMANQTSLTLNERFSGLRNKGRFTSLQDTGRMVTLP
ncbi:UAP56-interacting factor [Pogona vitticeps]